MTLVGSGDTKDVRRTTPSRSSRSCVRFNETDACPVAPRMRSGSPFCGMGARGSTSEKAPRLSVMALGRDHRTPSTFSAGA
jgi:hypothetical protein